MRKALVVGIDYYQNISSLSGAVNDAYEVKGVLERNADGSPNFGVKLLVSTGESSAITKRALKDAVVDLFVDDVEIALFFFAGHGSTESTGGYLITSDVNDGDDGFSMDELLTIVNKSPARNKIIVLDCCHSGAAGSPQSLGGNSFLSEGVTILTASSAHQYSKEKGGKGVFTSLMVDAMNGSAANLVGDITPGSVYAHIDQSLGPWEQRPLFKTNVKRFVSLRKTTPPIALDELHSISVHFPDPTYIFPLDPSYEPESDCPQRAHTEIFAVLQRLNRLNLVVPVDEEHMYFAAMNSTGCRLTVLGAHYWNLVKNNRI